LNYNVNGECGALASAATFGTVGGGTNYDPDLLRGWGKRINNWEMTAGVQHELMPRVSLTVQYARRWYGNFRVTDDTNVTATDYTRFTVGVPNDSRVPNSGGTVTALDLTPTGFARPAQYLVTLAKNYGDMTEVFTGVNIGLQARLQNGLILQGGVGPGRRACALRRAPLRGRTRHPRRTRARPTRGASSPRSSGTTPSTGSRAGASTC